MLQSIKVFKIKCKLLLLIKLQSIEYFKLFSHFLLSFQIYSTSGSAQRGALGMNSKKTIKHAQREIWKDVYFHNLDIH